MTSSIPLEYADDRTKERAFLGVPVVGWVGAGVVAILMVATFRFNLVRLWGKTNPFTGESEWAHGLLVPVISLYYLYLHREEATRATVTPLLVSRFGRGRLFGAAALVATGLVSIVAGPVLFSSPDLFVLGGKGLLALAGLVLALDWGIAMLVFGIVFFAYGIWPGQNDYFKDLGMLCALFGAVLTLCGWQIMRVAWFPIAFLICAIPWPGLVYSKVALPLQVLAARVAAELLSMMQLDAYQYGSKLHIGAATLNVEEACAGLKSLMTFVTLGGGVAFLTTRPLWQRLIITFSAVPIAILCNVLRVTVQGLFHHYGGAQWSENFAHQFVGMMMLVPAFLLILLVTWVLDRLFVEEGDQEVLQAASAAAVVARRGGQASTAPASAGIVPGPMAPVPVRQVKENAAVVMARKRAAAQPVTAGVSSAVPNALPAVASAAASVSVPAASGRADEAGDVRSPVSAPPVVAPLVEVPAVGSPPLVAPRRRASVVPVFVKPSVPGGTPAVVNARNEAQS